MLNLSVNRMSDSEKAQLTTWVIDQWLRGNQQPEITFGVILCLWRKRPLPVHVRADRLLRFISSSTRTQQLGQYVNFHRSWSFLFAWSESTDRHDVEYLLDYLEKMNWLERDPLGVGIGYAGGWRVSVEGHSRVDELEREENASSTSQAFVAMWFDDSTDGAYREGIEPAIGEAGYVPFRIDQKEHLNKIDDEIIAEIRRSRFVVADFTQGDSGARGGVYYEAGFAHGLNLPVIFTCHADSVEDLHFDTSHYNHLVWRTPDELREKLKNRIVANIGPGPEI